MANTPNKLQKLTAEKQELAKRCNDLEQKLNAIYSRNQDPDITTMYHQLEDRYNIVLEQLKELKAENQRLKNSAEVPTDYTELQISLDNALEDLRYERALNKRLQSELEQVSTTLPPKKPKPVKKPKQAVMGRPKKLDDDTINTILELRKNGTTVRAIASQLSLSVGSVSKVVNEYK